MNRVIGIDLGTTNSVVTIKQGSDVHVIEVENNLLIPSVFYYNRDKNLRLVGRRAKNRGLIDPQNVIRSTKRYIDTKKTFTASNENFTAEDIAVEILLKIKESVYRYLGSQEPLDAVITVPNNFSTLAVENTKNAGIRAGFENVTTLKEPIAAVLAYGEELAPLQNAMYFVCDFGGGTLDIAVVSYDGQQYEVIATGGNERLGGEDFTQVMIDYIYDQILDQLQIDLTPDTITGNVLLENLYANDDVYLRMKAKLYEKAEYAKTVLSVDYATEVEISELCIRNNQSIPFQCQIQREDYMNYSKTKRLLRDFKEAVEEVIHKMEIQNIHINDVDKVIMVGGSMNLPAVKNIIHDLLPVDILDQHLDTVVAIGASRKVTMKKAIIPRLNYNLGIMISGNRLSAIIPEQSQYPIEKAQIYTTSEDNQTELYFEVYEGNVLDNVYNSHNHWLGRLTINDIEAQPKGTPRIQVTFSLDNEGILYITAEDLSNHHQVKTELNWKELKH